MVSGLKAPENGIQTSNGRRFVTSNGAVYELTYSGAAWSAKKVSATYLDGSAPSCYFTGITEMFGNVYVACTEDNMSASAKKHLLAMNISAATPALAEIYRIDALAMPNGMTSDGNGTLYLNDMGATMKAGSLYRIKINSSSPTTVAEMKSFYSFSGLKPNGLKYKNSKLYITVDPTAYLGTSQLQSYSVTASGLSGKTVIYSSSNFLDDFIVVGDGFVVAEYLGSKISHISASGATLQTASFSSPTSVTFLSGSNATSGDLMVTEASSSGNVYRLINNWNLTQ